MTRLISFDRIENNPTIAHSEIFGNAQRVALTLRRK
jgi:hypothetical protein